MKWEPIETAPKDGAQVILFVPSLSTKVWLGNYSDVETFRHGKSTYKHQGWSLDGFIHLGEGSAPLPTHWMPIPDAPG